MRSAAPSAFRAAGRVSSSSSVSTAIPWAHLMRASPPGLGEIGKATSKTGLSGVIHDVVRGLHRTLQPLAPAVNRGRRKNRPIPQTCDAPAPPNLPIIRTAMSAGDASRKALQGDLSRGGSCPVSGARATRGVAHEGGQNSPQVLNFPQLPKRISVEMRHSETPSARRPFFREVRTIVTLRAS